jgi:hypothetical protein
MKLKGKLDSVKEVLIKKLDQLKETNPGKKIGLVTFGTDI